MKITDAAIRQIRAEALARAKDRSLPMSIRVRSRETVELCDRRLAR